MARLRHEGLDQLGADIAAVDPRQVAETVIFNPRRAAVMVPTVGIIAMARRLLELDAIAGGAAELLARLGELHSPAADSVRNTSSIAPLTATLAAALTALGHDPTTPDKTEETRDEHADQAAG